MRSNKMFRWTKSARLNKVARRISAKHLSRRWTVRLAAVVVLMLAVYTAANWNEAHTSPAQAQDRIAVSAVTRTTPPSTAPAALKTANAPAAAAAEKTVSAKAPVITITGCLERDDETFRLKDTTGADAPKSRSWKTGFLTKRAATIEVDANSETLQRYVGQRVIVTGVLVDRDMQVQSLKRVAASCGASKA